MLLLVLSSGRGHVLIMLLELFLLIFLIDAVGLWLIMLLLYS